MLSKITQHCQEDIFAILLYGTSVNERTFFRKYETSEQKSKIMTRTDTSETVTEVALQAESFRIYFDEY